MDKRLHHYGDNQLQYYRQRRLSFLRNLYGHDLWRAGCDDLRRRSLYLAIQFSGFLLDKPEIAREFTGSGDGHMTRKIPRVLSDQTASTAAEFAMVLPLLLLLTIGLIEAGRFMWTCNRAEKATQMGVRYAVATDIVPGGLVNYSFVGATRSDGTTITQGDAINDPSVFAGATCLSSSGTVTCTCDTSGSCPDLGTPNPTAFNDIVARMQLFMPELTADNVKIDYAYSGLGYAGDPNGIDVAPLVKVSLRDIVFHARLLAGLNITLPAFSAALTLEDGQGSVAN